MCRTPIRRIEISLNPRAIPEGSLLELRFSLEHDALFTAPASFFFAHRVVSLDQALHVPRFRDDPASFQIELDGSDWQPGGLRLFKTGHDPLERRLLGTEYLTRFDGPIQREVVLARLPAARGRAGVETRGERESRLRRGEIHDDGELLCRALQGRLGSAELPGLPLAGWATEADRLEGLSR